MSGTSEKVSGAVNQTIGKIKQSVGTMVGSDELTANGITQELKGHAQQLIGDAEGAAAEPISPGSASDREVKIRNRAYRIWEEEGRPEGREQNHWSQAQSEIESEDFPSR